MRDLLVFTGGVVVGHFAWSALAAAWRTITGWFKKS